MSIPSKRDVCILLWYNISLYKERSDVLRYFPRGGKFNTLRSQPPLTHPFLFEEATRYWLLTGQRNFSRANQIFALFFFLPVAFQFPTFCRDQIKSSTKLSPWIFFAVLCHQRSSFFKPLPPSSFFRSFFSPLSSIPFFFEKVSTPWNSDRTFGQIERGYMRDFTIIISRTSAAITWY